MDPRTPVLVGVGAITDRVGGRTPYELMSEAAGVAVSDAGAPSILARASLVAAPRGTWTDGDPCRQLARSWGATARTLIAEVGVLQTTLFARAVAAIAAGADVVVVVGAEAAATAKRQGHGAGPKPGTAETDSVPDEVLRPHGSVISGLEIARSFWTPAHQYALIERSLGRPPAELDETWAGWSEFAAANPDAWRPEAISAEALACGSATNPAVAVPYGRRHCSQMNVDQSAALIFASVEEADRLGIPESQRVYPWAIVESNHMVPVPERLEPGRSPGFAAVARALEAATGRPTGSADLVDLYSCFPSAVEVQRREFGFAADRALTVTGGMSFAGGPFNNYVLQSAVRAVQLLRERPGTHGLVTAISGMITKQGASWWSTEPPAAGAVVADVTDEVAALPTAPLVAEPDAVQGSATVVTSTVVGSPADRAWVLAELPDGTRTLVSSDDPAVVAGFLDGPGVGDAIVVDGAAFRPA